MYRNAICDVYTASQQSGNVYRFVLAAMTLRRGDTGCVEKMKNKRKGELKKKLSNLPATPKKLFLTVFTSFSPRGRKTGVTPDGTRTTARNRSSGNWRSLVFFGRCALHVGPET